MLNTKKLAVVPLLIYWPTIFVLTLIPIPTAVRQANVSDKSLHLIAFMVLTFLLWFAVRPFEKITYKGFTIWWVAAAAVLYGAFDEIFQGFCGRGRDIYDFLANISGVLGCVVFLTIFSFRVAWMVVTLAVIITAATVSKVNLAEAMPKIYTAFHVFAYGIFSLAWIEYLRHRRPALRLKSIWGLVIILTAPVGLLLVMKAFSALAEKTLTTANIIAALVGIAGVTGVTFVLFHLRKRSYFQAGDN